LRVDCSIGTAQNSPERGRFHRQAIYWHSQERASGGGGEGVVVEEVVIINDGEGGGLQ
jgi:hypothetical protein